MVDMSADIISKSMLLLFWLVCLCGLDGGCSALAMGRPWPVHGKAMRRYNPIGLLTHVCHSLYFHFHVILLFLVGWLANVLCVLCIGYSILWRLHFDCGPETVLESTPFSLHFHPTPYLGNSCSWLSAYLPAGMHTSGQLQVTCYNIAMHWRGLSQQDADAFLLIEFCIWYLTIV